jgi:hypothetical protein
MNARKLCGVQDSLPCSEAENRLAGIAWYSLFPYFLIRPSCRNGDNHLTGIYNCHLITVVLLIGILTSCQYRVATSVDPLTIHTVYKTHFGKKLDVESLYRI